MYKYKISVLKDELPLINEVGVILTAKQVYEGVTSGAGVDTEEVCYTKKELIRSKWYIASEGSYSINAYAMILGELEDSTNTDTVPGWFNKVRDAVADIPDDVLKKVEDLIMNELKKTDGILNYYEKGEPVDIEK